MSQVTIKKEMLSLNKTTKITVISTGGTIEKTYDEDDGSLINRGPSLDLRLKETLRLPYTDIDLLPLMSKDSLYLTDEDRNLILEAILQRQENGQGILVLHGTDTMDLTARHCARKILKPKVPIIFTGAMRPFGFIDTDAIQNATEGLMAAQLASPGVYICFHNRLYPGDQVRKNRSKRTFEYI